MRAQMSAKEVVIFLSVALGTGNVLGQGTMQVRAFIPTAPHYVISQSGRIIKEKLCFLIKKKSSFYGFI